MPEDTINTWADYYAGHTDHDALGEAIAAMEASSKLKVGGKIMPEEILYLGNDWNVIRGGKNGKEKPGIPMDLIGKVKVVKRIVASHCPVALAVSAASLGCYNEAPFAEKDNVAYLTIKNIETLIEILETHLSEAYDARIKRNA